MTSHQFLLALAIAVIPTIIMLMRDAWASKARKSDRAQEALVFDKIAAVTERIDAVADKMTVIETRLNEIREVLFRQYVTKEECERFHDDLRRQLEIIDRRRQG